MDYNSLFLIISIVITIGAQILVSSRYSKYKNIENNSKMSGCEVALKLLKEHNLEDIYVIETQGNLTDHYDPNNKVIRLSTDIFHGTSIASASVAAHEVGHAIQYKEGNILLKIRSFIYPLVSFCSRFSYIVIILGIIFGVLEIFYIGVGLFVFILLFQLLTLPVEFDASKKALNILNEEKVLDKSCLEGARSMLVAAALTYVASLATTVLQLLRLIGMGNNRNND